MKDAPLPKTWYVPPVRTKAKHLLGSSIACVVFAIPAAAWADASAWAYAGGGALLLKEGTEQLTPRAAMSFEFGMGTNPDGKFILGGLARLTPVFDLGPDMALCLRAATHGFQASRFGAALDVGYFQRLWGSYSSGATGTLTIGFPLGFSLSLHGIYATNDTLGFGAMAGIDFLRLTVYRQVLLDSWPNPHPGHQVPPAESARWMGPWAKF
jgi:hypothetical protein